MMYDTRTRDRKWNITYYDYSSNMGSREPIQVKINLIIFTKRWSITLFLKMFHNFMYTKQRRYKKNKKLVYISDLGLRITVTLIL